MFRISLCALVFLVAFNGCRKSDEEKAMASLTAKWSLKKVRGSWGPEIFYSGNEESVIFTKTFYKFLERDSVVKSGSYTIEESESRNPTCSLLAFTHKLVFDNNPNKVMYVRISADSLTLGWGCFAADSGIEKYYTR